MSACLSDQQKKSSRSRVNYIAKQKNEGTGHSLHKPFVAVRDALVHQMEMTRDLQMQAVQEFVQADF